MRRTGVHGTMIITIGGAGGNGPRTLAAVAGKGALAAMAQGFAKSLAANRIQVFGLALDDEQGGVAAPAQPRGARDRRTRRRQCADAIRRDHRFAQASTSGK